MYYNGTATVAQKLCLAGSHYTVGVSYYTVRAAVEDILLYLQWYL